MASAAYDERLSKPGDIAYFRNLKDEQDTLDRQLYAPVKAHLASANPGGAARAGA